MSIRLFLYRFAKAIRLFSQRRGVTLAAASSFYILMTMVPLALLLLRVVGSFLGDIGQTEAHFFALVGGLFPQAAPEMVELLRKIISGPLFGNKGLTGFNVVILTFTSLGLVNSVWNGIFLITEDKTLLSWKNYLKGIVVIGMTAVLLVCAFALPPFILLVISVIKSNTILTYLSGVVPNFDYVVQSINWLSWWATYLVKSNLFYGTILLVYFTFLYLWFFNWKLKLKGAVLGAFTFVVSLVVGKWAFVVYFQYARTNLVANYGDYYTFIVGLMWIFLVMCFFFFGMCLCHVYNDTDRDDLEKTISRIYHRILVIIRINFRLFFKLFRPKI
ncbi:MAG: YihY/virulence factor BrkB family protein [Bacteriovoracaceae bacterium]|nr:YihY/virulence factor BrkB family protein [Bacteriovoracaceae bacterium]